MTPRWTVALLSLLGAIALGLAVDTARRAAACYDEPKHLATGAYAWREGRFLGDDNAPAIALHGWPAWACDWDLPPAPDELAPNGKRLGLFAAGSALLERNGVLATLFPARLTSVALFALLLLLVAIEGRDAGGSLGAVVALTLTAFSPVLLSHASLVSADLPLAVAGAFVVHALRRYLRLNSKRRAVVLGLACGAALAAKLTGLVFVGGVGLAFVLRLRDASIRATTLRHAAITLIATAGVVCLVTAFDPALYVRQYQLVSNYAAASAGEYFRGTIGSGSPWFYPGLLAFKLEPALALGLAAASFAAWRRHRTAEPMPTALPLLFALLVLAATCASGYRQGVRFLLPMWPLLAITAASAVSSRSLPSRTTTAGALALAGLAATTAFAAHPNHLAYWNPLVRGDGDAWYVDSNHDWGQDLTTLATWQREHREVAVYGALWTSVPPTAYGIEFGNLFDDPTTLTRFDPSRKTLLVLSVSLLRLLAADPGRPLSPIARHFSEITADVEFGDSIRGYWIDQARLAELR